MAIGKKINSLLTDQYGNVKYSKPVYTVLLCALVGVSAYSAYGWYATHKEQAAQKVFAECIHEYQKALVDSKMWPNVDMVFKHGYKQHSASTLAPYFLAYRADALYQQDKKDEARELMNQMVQKIPASSPVYNVYRTKMALMNIDGDDADVKQSGFKELETLAHDAKNINRDEALYYLGMYHWSNNELAQAKTVWQELAAMQGADKQSRSPWASAVEEKLQQIV